MLKKLRWQLTVLYLTISMLFIVAVGGGLYVMLHYYFQATTDMALKYRLAQELTLIGAPIPPEISNSGNFLKGNFSLFSLFGMKFSGEETDDPMHGYSEHAYEGELAPIFVLGLSDTGASVDNGSPAPPLSIDPEAAQYAVESAMDLRTVALSDGTPIRLLTYRLPSGYMLSLIQLGRPTGDQARILRDYLTGLICLSSLSLLMLGLGSWWLAGRSLKPAQEAFEQQQAFVANASHELRTPLTIIRASAELAGRSRSKSETQELLDDVIADTDYMSKLVEDLLLLSRLDKKQLKLERKPVGVAEVLVDIQRQAERIAKPKGIRVEVSAGVEKVIGDQVHLKQVVWILVDNALRHSKQDGVVKLSAQEYSKRVSIAVSDTGAGVAPEHIKHVFERFYNTGGENDNRSTGLGLSIAKGLVEVMGGKIALESTVGRGTVVTVWLDKV
jgi:signal transduction histidine kinase